MARKKRTTQKGKNGTGQNMTVYFDTTDKHERQALEMAQILASKQPGRRKDIVVAVLSAMYEQYQASGEIMSITEIASALQGGAPRPSMGFTYAVATAPAAASAGPATHTPAQTRQPGGVVVTSAAKKASAQEIASNFLSSMGNLFD